MIAAGVRSPVSTDDAGRAKARRLVKPGIYLAHQGPGNRPASIGGDDLGGIRQRDIARSSHRDIWRAGDHRRRRIIHIDDLVAVAGSAVGIRGRPGAGDGIAVGAVAENGRAVGVGDIDRPRTVIRGRSLAGNRRQDATTALHIRRRRYRKHRRRDVVHRYVYRSRYLRTAAGSGNGVGHGVRANGACIGIDGAGSRVNGQAGGRGGEGAARTGKAAQGHRYDAGVGAQSRAGTRVAYGGIGQLGNGDGRRGRHCRAAAGFGNGVGNGVGAGRTESQVNRAGTAVDLKPSRTGIGAAGISRPRHRCRAAIGTIRRAGISDGSCRQCGNGHARIGGHRRAAAGPRHRVRHRVSARRAAARRNGACGRINSQIWRRCRKSAAGSISRRDGQGRQLRRHDGVAKRLGVIEGADDRQRRDRYLGSNGHSRAIAGNRCGVGNGVNARRAGIGCYGTICDIEPQSRRRSGISTSSKRARAGDG